MPSWVAEPERLTSTWSAYRQTAPDTAPLFHAAGEQAPSQRSGRWHRYQHGYAQYLSLEAAGCWCELIRYERIRASARSSQYTRRLWLVHVEERDIADLSTFEAYEKCGLDPRIAVGGHESSQDLADELREEGFRGVLSPSAALPGATNLTLFGVRYEKVLETRVDQWANPNPDLRLACNLLAESPPSQDLITRTCFEDMDHDGYRGFLRSRGQPMPSSPP